jgi:hypothetical protein
MYRWSSVPGAAEGDAVLDVVPTAGQPEDVEVLLVDDDVADEAGVGVDTGPDHQAAGLRLLGVDVEDHVGLVAREHGHATRGAAATEVGQRAGLLEAGRLVGVGLRDRQGREAGRGPRAAGGDGLLHGVRIRRRWRCGKPRIVEGAGSGLRQGLPSPALCGLCRDALLECGLGHGRLLGSRLLIRRLLWHRRREDGHLVAGLLGDGVGPGYGLRRLPRVGGRRGRHGIAGALPAPHGPARGGGWGRPGWVLVAGRSRQPFGRGRLPFGGLVPIALQHQIDHRVTLVVGALAAEARAFGIAGHPRALVAGGLRETDLRPLPLRRVGGEQAARLQPPLVLAELADVEDVTGPQREPVEHHAVPGVRVVAADPDVDLADPVALPLADVVDEVELTWLLEEPRIGLDVGEHEAAAAVDVADLVEILVHLGLVEELASLELQLPLQKLGLELAVAHERDVANGVSRSLVDHEGDVRPVAHALAHDRHLAAHLGLEEAETAVVGRQGVDVAVDHLLVDVAPQEPEHARLALDLREQPPVAGDRVADEAGPHRLAGPPLVDQEHRPLVARLAALDRGHAGRLVALLVVVALDPAPGLFDHVWVHRVAHVDLGLLAKRAGGDPLVADVAHVPQHRPLDHLEDDHHAVGHADILRMHVDELPRAVQRPHVLLHRARVEGLAGSGHELGELRDLGRLVALDPNLDDQVGLRGGGHGRHGRQRGRAGGVGRPYGRPAPDGERGEGRGGRDSAGRSEAGE